MNTDARGTVYLLVFPNGKRYVGVTTSSFEDRMESHRIAGLSKTTPVALAINEFGWDCVGRVKLAEGIPVEYLHVVEREMILENKSMHPRGYNRHLPHGDVKERKVGRPNKYDSRGGVFPIYMPIGLACEVRLFAKSVGMSFSEYINRQLMLLHPDWKRGEDSER